MTDAIRRSRCRDITGEKFGRLTVIGLSRIDGKRTYWSCRCDCGNLAVVRGDNLKSGKSSSCDCLRMERAVAANTKHGHARSPEWLTWIHIVQRCLNANRGAYGNYGGRGISVADRWRGDDGFLNFLADMGVRPGKGFSIERINNERGYEPGNCRWATVAEQNRNKRDNHVVEFEGTRLCVTDWAVRVGIHRRTLFNRLSRGWSVERALTTPAEPKTSRAK